MNHSRGRRIKATFSDGSVADLTTEKGFTHAWQVNGLKAARPTEITGWARSEELAQQAATSHARSVAKHWRNVRIEVVEPNRFTSEGDIYQRPARSSLSVCPRTY